MQLSLLIVSAHMELHGKACIGWIAFEVHQAVIRHGFHTYDCFVDREFLHCADILIQINQLISKIWGPEDRVRCHDPGLIILFVNGTSCIGIVIGFRHFAVVFHFLGRTHAVEGLARIQKTFLHGIKNIFCGAEQILERISLLYFFFRLNFNKSFSFQPVNGVLHGFFEGSAFVTKLGFSFGTIAFIVAVQHVDIKIGK